jgi:hypothetical protein
VFRSDPHNSFRVAISIDDHTQGGPLAADNPGLHNAFSVKKSGGSHARGGVGGSKSATDDVAKKDGKTIEQE